MLKKLPLEERPREKMMHLGAMVLSNSELLAIIIRTGTRDASAIDVSRKVLGTLEGDFSELSQATLEELCAVEGIGESKACQILAAIELGKRLNATSIKRKVRLASPKDVIRYFSAELSQLRVEKFIGVFLNTKSEVINWDVISVGTLNAAIVHPREVYSRALKRSAASLLVLHNHPSGHPAPSREDRLITERLDEVGKIMGIPLIDHIIIGYNDYYSFKEENQL